VISWSSGRPAAAPSATPRISDPLVIDEENRYLLVGFDLAVWLGDLELDDADVEPNGDILIDEDLLEDFEDNLEEAINLFDDSDEDGDLDEDDDPLAER
jgi:hypothetical protein